MIAEAIASLAPDAEWSLNGDSLSGLKWISEDISRPSDEQIEAESKRLIELAKANAYKPKRAAKMPSLGDQLDAIWHAMDDGRLPKVAEFYDPIKAVKDEIPKG